MCKQYKAKNGAMQWKPSFEWIETAVRNDNMEGFCLACKNEQMGIEPDAGKVQCDACGEYKVYGAEQLLLMGLYH